ncbi:hypothetical protein CspeluHIS016_0101270 [Cutaneotrichosporon spelunceum]|uniref:Thioesterase/thiol ester dehydrase-isomerase n=1 Tax=Cutaneotrichosporon spelunceum TaxID=1672016 RepID=A0AAD3Y7J4_9TREE|nr:hypothetical protein CspeluHIS016_0101270 [Cutaneotrichosporon spelunceum]
MSLRALRPLVHLRTRALHTTGAVREVNDLMAKFKNPASPYYLAPGEVGPASPDDHTVSRPLPGDSVEWDAPAFATSDRAPKLPHMDRGYDRERATAHEWFDSNGFDTEGRVEWPVAWGDSDMYRHINNVSYCRYVESARMKWIESLVPDLGEVGEDYLYGRRTGFILKEQAVRYRYPVTYPDSLIIASKPHGIKPERAEFKIHCAMWSLKANRLALTCESTCTIYDFDKLKKGVMSDAVRAVLEARASA